MHSKSLRDLISKLARFNINIVSECSQANLFFNKQYRFGSCFIVTVLLCKFHLIVFLDIQGRHARRLECVETAGYKESKSQKTNSSTVSHYNTKMRLDSETLTKVR